MGSDNPSSADNQQERLLTNDWLVGFVDGEGCFSCPVFRNRTMRLGWQVQPSFTVVQGESSRAVLEAMVAFFGCGKVYINRRHDNHREHLCSYQVFKFVDLRDVIVPFFHANPLQTAKRDNFAKFVEIIDLIDQRQHLTASGLAAIARIAETMNHRKPRGVENPQRPYADPLPGLAGSG
jgi:LAGLIDADG endonuclease